MTLVQCLDSAADPRHLDTAEAMFPFLCNANIGQDSVFQSGGGVSGSTAGASRRTSESSGPTPDVLTQKKPRSEHPGFKQPSRRVSGSLELRTTPLGAGLLRGIYNKLIWPIPAF